MSSSQALKQIVALRLTVAATEAWGRLGIEVNQDLRDTTQAYLGAVALLFAYVIYTSESLAKSTYSEEMLNEIFSAFKADVLQAIETQRQTRPEQRVVAPKEAKSEVH